MKSHIADLLICPACLPEEMGLVSDAHESHGIEIVSGVLKCPECLKDYVLALG